MAGGKSEVTAPIVRYIDIIRICRRGLFFGSYSASPTELSGRVLDLRDRSSLPFRAIAETLISQGYRSPRGFDPGRESVFSVYKKRKRRHERVHSAPAISIFVVEIEHLEWHFD